MDTLSEFVEYLNNQALVQKDPRRQFNCMTRMTSGLQS